MLGLLLAVIAAAPAQAGERTLGSAREVVKFSDRVSTGDVVLFPVRVQLPRRTWEKPGGVQFGVTWPYDFTLRTQQDPARQGVERPDLDIEVLDSTGAVIASMAGTDSDAESVVVREPANGVYTVRVTAAQAEDLPFRGRAEVEYLPRRAPVRDLLPDLTVLPQRNARFGPQQQIAWPSEKYQWIGGCLAEEFSEEGARRCLRFDQSIANAGRGAMELRYSLRDAGTDQLMYQRIHRSDGSVRERAADRYELHPTHLHFHYTSFALSRLWRADAKGRRVGTAPVREGNKNGFCLIDVENFGFDGKGDAAHTYLGDGCADPDALTLADLTHGISPGWSDLYNWFLPGQYIEITGVPDGRYLLETIADPRNTIVESDETNNVTSVIVDIHGQEVGLRARTPQA
jgi:hypothetical protein